jgi:hypothetical protein
MSNMTYVLLEAGTAYPSRAPEHPRFLVGFVLFIFFVFCVMWFVLFVLVVNSGAADNVGNVNFIIYTL